MTKVKEKKHPCTKNHQQASSRMCFSLGWNVLNSDQITKEDGGKHGIERNSFVPGSLFLKPCMGHYGPKWCLPFTIDWELPVPGKVYGDTRIPLGKSLPVLDARTNLLDGLEQLDTLTLQDSLWQRRFVHYLIEPLGYLSTSDHSPLELRSDTIISLYGGFRSRIMDTGHHRAVTTSRVSFSGETQFFFLLVKSF